MMARRLTSLARSMRREPTEAEACLWRHLRNRQVENAKFLRQSPIGPHIADFACEAARMVIECDGGQHSPEAHADRTQAIEAAGYTILRFWNHDILQNTPGVLEGIRQTLILTQSTKEPKLEAPLQWERTRKLGSKAALAAVGEGF